MDSPLTPDGWLILGLPWSPQASGGYAECAAAIAPQVVPRQVVGQDAGCVLDLASALIRSHDGTGKAVFFSDITLLLDGQGKTWGDLGIDYEQVIDALLEAPVPLLYLTLSQAAHAILCDASREGVRLYYQDGQVEHVTSEMRRDVHTALAAALENDWQHTSKA